MRQHVLHAHCGEGAPTFAANSVVPLAKTDEVSSSRVIKVAKDAAKDVTLGGVQMVSDVDGKGEVQYRRLSEQKQWANVSGCSHTEARAKQKRARDEDRVGSKFKGSRVVSKFARA